MRSNAVRAAVAGICVCLMISWGKASEVNVDVHSPDLIKPDTLVIDSTKHAVRNQKSSADEAPGDAVVLEKMVVTESSVNRHTASFTYLDADYFLGEYIDLGSVLEGVSGVNIRRTGGFGQYCEATIRGGAARDVVVYLDDVLLNAGEGAAVNLSSIPLGLLQSVTVYKDGYAPLELAGKQMGGVISLSTSEKTSPRTLGVDCELGSFGYRRFAALYQESTGNLHHHISIDYAGSRNDYPYTHDNGTTLPTRRNPDPTWDDLQLRRKNAQASQLSLLYRTSVSTEERLTFRAQAGYDKSKRGLFNSLHRDEQDGDESADRIHGLIHADFNLSPYFRTDLQLSSVYNHSFLDDKLGHFSFGIPGKRYSRMPHIDGFIKASWDLSEAFGVGFLIGGGYESLKRESEHSDQENRKFARKYSGRWGLELTYGREKLSLSLRALGRYESDLVRDNMQSPKESDELFPSLQARIQISPRSFWTIQTTVSHSSRSPSYFERFGWGNGFIASVFSSPDLSAETRTEADCGTSLHFSCLNTTAAVHIARIDDKIKTIQKSNRQFQNENYSDVLVRGFEWDIAFDPWSFLSLSNSFSFIRSTVISSQFSSWKGKNESYLPSFQNMSSVQLRYRIFRLTHSFYVQGPYFLDTDNLQKWDENKPVLSAGLSCFLFNRIDLSYRLENYLNVHNMDFRHMLRPGRQHIVTLTGDILG